ncbi:hypothetical protein FGO68_gene5823 [Halteria grandinella]|uniref:Uncharacterized protein n=1 Tax=Halteria grandinella TaxID=5974 RepID=A0A8J8NRA0_HALGN|nr:hypothetical protein FGO68_gene5823 [Halteria grandinella]
MSKESEPGGNTPGAKEEPYDYQFSEESENYEAIIDVCQHMIFVPHQSIVEAFFEESKPRGGHMIKNNPNRTEHKSLLYPICEPGTFNVDRCACISMVQPDERNLYWENTDPPLSSGTLIFYDPRDRETFFKNIQAIKDQRIRDQMALKPPQKSYNQYYLVENSPPLKKVTTFDLSKSTSDISASTISQKQRKKAAKEALSNTGPLTFEVAQDIAGMSNIKLFKLELTNPDTYQETIFHITDDLKEVEEKATKETHDLLTKSQQYRVLFHALFAALHFQIPYVIFTIMALSKVDFDWVRNSLFMVSAPISFGTYVVFTMISYFTFRNLDKKFEENKLSALGSLYYSTVLILHQTLPWVGAIAGVFILFLSIFSSNRNSKLYFDSMTAAFITQLSSDALSTIIFIIGVRYYRKKLSGEFEEQAAARKKMRMEKLQEYEEKNRLPKMLDRQKERDVFYQSEMKGRKKESDRGLFESLIIE